MKRQDYRKKKKEIMNILEKRQINVSYGKNGQGFKTTRISIPKKYFEKIGITEEKREVSVILYNDKIEIRRK